MNRRRFLKLCGMAVAGAGLPAAGIAVAGPPAWMSEKLIVKLRESMKRRKPTMLPVMFNGKWYYVAKLNPVIVQDMRGAA